MLKLLFNVEQAKMINATWYGVSKNNKKIGHGRPMAIRIYREIPPVSIGAAGGCVPACLRHCGEAGPSAGFDERQAFQTARDGHTVQEVTSESDPPPGSEPGKT